MSVEDVYAFPDLSYHDDDEDDSEGVLIAKGVSMAVLFVTSMICGLAPMLLSKKFTWMAAPEAGNIKNTSVVIRTLLSFGGGVLLSTTFMHLMPEVEHNIEHLVHDGLLPRLEFSLTPLLTCCGFFMMYLIEELVHLYIHRREKKNGQTASLARNLSVRKSNHGESSVTNSTADLVDTPSATKGKDLEKNGHGHSHGHGHGHGHSHMPVNTGDSDDVTSALRGLLIVLALSIHELFEGLAVGLESSTSNVWYMLGAISAHKLVIAFCVGVELIATRTKTWLAITYITTFAIITSLGMGIGMLLVGGGGASAAGVPSVILQGLAAGTLLYVIFFEIWNGNRSGMLQYAASVIGFFLMFGLQLLTPHTHSHGHSHGGDHGHSHDK